MKKSHNYILMSVILLSLFIFLILAGIYSSTGSFIFDNTAASYLFARRNPSLNKLFIFITSAGNVFSIIVFSLAAIIILYWRKMKRDAVFFGINIAGLWVFNELLKYAFKRPRPSVPRIVNASGFSFPSGHAMISMGFAALTIFYIISYVKNRSIAFFISVLLFAYSLLVGMSRVYLGAHYLSDVIAGWAGGIFWASFTIILFETINIKKEGSRTE
jgi:undecaprenyl-diphosphatase